MHLANTNQIKLKSVNFVSSRKGTVTLKNVRRNMGRKKVHNNGKLKVDRCLEGRSHSLDLWKIAEAIVSGRLKIGNVSPKSLMCCINDLRMAIDKNREV